MAETYDELLDRCVALGLELRECDYCGGAKGLPGACAQWSCATGKDRSPAEALLALVRAGVWFKPLERTNGVSFQGFMYGADSRLYSTPLYGDVLTATMRTFIAARGGGS